MLRAREMMAPMPSISPHKEAIMRCEPSSGGSRTVPSNWQRFSSVKNEIPFGESSHAKTSGQPIFNVILQWRVGLSQNMWCLAHVVHHVSHFRFISKPSRRRASLSAEPSRSHTARNCGLNATSHVSDALPMFRHCKHWWKLERH